MPASPSPPACCGRACACCCRCCCTAGGRCCCCCVRLACCCRRWSSEGFCRQAGAQVSAAANSRVQAAAAAASQENLDCRRLQTGQAASAIRWQECGAAPSATAGRARSGAPGWGCVPSSRPSLAIRQGQQTCSERRKPAWGTATQPAREGAPGYPAAQLAACKRLPSSHPDLVNALGCASLLPARKLHRLLAAAPICTHELHKLLATVATAAGARGPRCWAQGGSA